jgi:micrococcal nuclease
MTRRVQRNSWQRALVALVVILLVAIRGWYERDSFEPPDSQQSRRHDGTLLAGECRVPRVIDGDTLLLEYARTRVRLQGIDTPETVKEDTAVEDWGPEATQYTKQFVQDANGRVRIENDGEAVDRYGRQLVFVWLDDRMLNEELVRQGLAEAKLGYDYSEAKKQQLRAAEDDAQRNHSGLQSSLFVLRVLANQNSAGRQAIGDRFLWRRLPLGRGRKSGQRC